MLFSEVITCIEEILETQPKVELNLVPVNHTLTGTTLVLLEIRSALVTWRVCSSVQRTSRVNSTEHSEQNSSHVQS